MHSVDNVATILLFVVLLGGVGLSVYTGAMSVMLPAEGSDVVSIDARLVGVH